MTLADLPAELVELIAQCLSRKRDVASLCLTCKHIYRDVINVLHHTVNLRFAQKSRLEYTEAELCGNKSLENTRHLAVFSDACYSLPAFEDALVKAVVSGLRRDRLRSFSSPEGIYISHETLEKIVETQTRLENLDIRWLGPERGKLMRLRTGFFAPWTATMISFATPSRLSLFANMDAYQYLLYRSPKLEELHIRHITAFDCSADIDLYDPRDIQRDEQLMGRLFDSKSTSPLHIKSLIMTEMSLFATERWLHHLSLDALTRLDLRDCMGFDRFVTHLVDTLGPHDRLCLNSFSYTKYGDCYYEEEIPITSFETLLSCCDLQFLKHISFTTDQAPAATASSRLLARIAKCSELCYLELGRGSLNETLDSNIRAALVDIAQNCQKVEEIVLPLVIDLDTMSVFDGDWGIFGDLFFCFATLPKVKAIRLVYEPKINEFPPGHNYGEDDLRRFKELLGKVADSLLKEIAVRLGDSSNVPLLAFGDGKGIGDWEERYQCIAFDEPLFYEYVIGHGDTRGGWARQCHPEKEDFEVFAPDCRRIWTRDRCADGFDPDYMYGI